MITAAGSGYSRWRDLAVTRWREDVTCDAWGTLRLPARRARAARSGRRATSRAAPSRTATRWRSPRTAPRSSAATAALATTLEVAVSPEDDAEVRRVSISNLGSRVAGDRAHLLRRARAGARPRPTRPIRPSRSSSCRRSSSPTSARCWRRGGRARRPSREVWAAHLAVVEGESVGDVRVRDRPGALPRARARHPHADLGDRRPAALGHGRRRARSDLQPAPPRADPARGDGARRVLDAGRAVAQRGARPGRQAPRPDRLRARGHAGLDPGAGRSSIISASGPTRRTSSSASPIACSTPTRRCGPRSEVLEPQRGRTVGALGARDLGRPADRAGADRRRRGPRDRPPAAARPRVLADEAARRRSRDPERAAGVLRAGSPGRARGAGAGEPVAAARASGTGARGSVFVLRADLVSAEARAVLRTRGARGAAQPPRQPRRAGQAAGGVRARARAARPRARRRASAPAAAAAAPGRSSSSTASAASPPAGAST